MKEIININKKTILITGAAGFIGANLVIRLLDEMTGGTIVSIDSMNDYYDPALKDYRLSQINSATMGKGVSHIFVKGNIADKHGYQPV